MAATLLVSGDSPSVSRSTPRRKPTTLNRKRLEQWVVAANSRAGHFRSKSVDQLQKQFQSFQADQLTMENPTGLIESLAIATCVIKKTIDIQLYPVQQFAGLVLALGGVAEMQTGEGKTFSSLFAIAVHAISRQGVHVATVNEYLAKRDFEQLRPAINGLGFTVEHSAQQADYAEKRKAYQADVTFATGYELGFDFLRDQVRTANLPTSRPGWKLRERLGFLKSPPPCQEKHSVAIIDEIDSVLIDEAVTPLVLSQTRRPDSRQIRSYQTAHNVAERLVLNSDFKVDPQTSSIQITERGLRQIKQAISETGTNQQSASPDEDQVVGRNPNHEMTSRLGSKLIDNLASKQPDKIRNIRLNRPWHEYVAAALKAQHCLKKDVHYVVNDSKIELVDEYTGRVFDDRSWQDGLHQAVEVKEQLPITGENECLARITRQRFFHKYDVLCGMTGTTDGCRSEFKDQFKLRVTSVPTRVPSQRKQLADKYFSDTRSKLDSIIDSVVELAKKGRPVLIGTRTIDQSCLVSEALEKIQVAHQVLNGTQSESEASIISKAGELNRITVATNMAGRGTDIRLDESARHLGGLHVIGFERHGSRRIDRQLQGRCARQGDPGSFQFFVGADDELLQTFGKSFSRRLRRLKHRNGFSSRTFDRQVRQLQSNSELASLQNRQQVTERDRLFAKMRKDSN